MENPTVFISYSHDNDAHKAWVLKLATDLRSHGVNAILDQWDLRVGSDLRFFMEQGLSEANLVLCICSKAYVDKFNSGNGGSGYEGVLCLLRTIFLETTYASCSGSTPASISNFVFLRIFGAFKASPSLSPTLPMKR